MSDRGIVFVQIIFIVLLFSDYLSVEFLFSMMIGIRWRIRRLFMFWRYAVFWRFWLMSIVDVQYLLALEPIRWYLKSWLLLCLCYFAARRCVVHRYDHLLILFEMLFGWILSLNFYLSWLILYFRRQWSRSLITSSIYGKNRRFSLGCGDVCCGNGILTLRTGTYIRSVS